MIEIFTSTRVQILSKLVERPYTASEIARATGYSKTTVSYHLSKLSEAGLVERLERGKWVYYRITPNGERRIKIEAVASISAFIGSIVSGIVFVALKLSERMEQFAVEKSLVPSGYGPYEIREVGRVVFTFDWTIILPVLSVLMLAVFLFLKFRK